MKKLPIQRGGFKDRKFLLVGIIVLLAVIVGLVGWGLSKIMETEEYYVLNRDVGARTQVTPDMLEPVVVPSGGIPKNVIGYDVLQTGTVYTNYPLFAGDSLTASNTASAEVLENTPDTWVQTSFSVPADSATGGLITRGSYFDLMVAKPEGSYYPFVNVLVLNSTIDDAQSTNADGTLGSQNVQYLVGMSPENAAKLQSVIQADGANVRLVVSPRQNQYAAPQIAEYNGVFTHSPTDAPVWPGKDLPNADAGNDPKAVAPEAVGTKQETTTDTAQDTTTDTAQDTTTDTASETPAADATQDSGN